MNARQANSISIRNYLSSIGISPVSSNKRSSLYLAPYRSETVPSLKVSHDQNLWVDYGNENKGGTLIDLVLVLNSTYNVSDAIRTIEKSTQSFFSFHQQELSHHSKNGIHITNHKLRNVKHVLPNSKCEKLNTKYEKTKTDYLFSKPENLKRDAGNLHIDKLQELGNNQAITAYLKLRGIQVATAVLFCKEVYYSIHDKQYFGLGNQNDRGWSIRNKYWKGCTAQGFSHYKNGTQNIYVFEGIFDLLSFMELNKYNQKRADLLVLNSLVNLKRGISIIKAYHQIDLFLDHDQAGRNATKLLMDILPDSRDASEYYSSCKDLNDYHLVKVKERIVNVKAPLIKNKQ